MKKQHLISCHIRVTKKQKAKLKKAVKTWVEAKSEADIIRHLIETYL